MPCIQLRRQRRPSPRFPQSSAQSCTARSCELRRAGARNRPSMPGLQAKWTRQTKTPDWCQLFRRWGRASSPARCAGRARAAAGAADVRGRRWQKRERQIDAAQAPGCGAVRGTARAFPRACLFRGRRCAWRPAAAAAHLSPWALCASRLQPAPQHEARSCRTKRGGSSPAAWLSAMIRPPSAQHAAHAPPPAPPR